MADWKKLYDSWGLLSDDIQEKIVLLMDTKAKEKTEDFKKWLLEDKYREKIYFEKLPVEKRFIAASPHETEVTVLSKAAAVMEVARVVEVSKVSEVSRVIEVTKSARVPPVEVGVMSASAPEVSTLPNFPMDAEVVKSSQISTEATETPLKTKVPTDVQKRRKLDSVIRKLETDPMLGMPLSGSLSGKRSLTIGSYRIIYTIDPHEKTILLYAAKRRKKT